MVATNFQEVVIEASHQRPVLVDFWAEWCGPCRMLTPVLEAVAADQPDRWQLVKVNTEENQPLAREYGIQSIPNCKLFYQGNIIAEFAGAMSRFQLERWLDQHLPDPRQAELDAAQQLTQHERTAALQQLQAKYPDWAAPRLALAHQQVFTQPAVSAALLTDDLFGKDTFEQAEDLKTLTELMQTVPNATPAAQALATAREQLQNADFAAAAESIIRAVVIDKHYQQDLPRRSAVALFRYLGTEHPVTLQYRRQFDMALY